MPDQKCSSERVAEEHGEADEVDHEEGDALQIDDEDLSRERGDAEKERSQKEDLDDDDREERLEIPPQMIRSDARVIGPRREGADQRAEEHSREGEDRGHEGSGPPAAEIGELGDRLGEQHLVGVALEVAQDRRAEDGGDDDHAEQAEPMSLSVFAYGPLSSTLPFALPTGPKLSEAIAEEREGEPAQKVDVGGNALRAELQLEGEELPEHGHERACPAARAQLRAWRETLRK